MFVELPSDDNYDGCDQACQSNKGCEHSEGYNATWKFRKKPWFLPVTIVVLCPFNKFQM